MDLLAHLSVMKQVKKLLSSQDINIKIDTGNLINVLESDITGNHDKWKERIEKTFWNNL